MKLLIEKAEHFETTCLVESEATEKSYYITGPFLQSEIKNYNGRIYPKQVLAKEVARYVKDKINTNLTNVGELDHPASPQVNLERASHKIISLIEDGNNFIGKAKIMNTPMGKIVKNLMDEGINFGVSSRGVGSLKESNGINVVCNDYHLLTPADIVSEPSGPNCYVEAIYEGKEWAFNAHGDLVEVKREKAMKIVDEVVKTHKVNEAALLEIFQRILNEVVL